VHCAANHATRQPDSGRANGGRSRTTTSALDPGDTQGCQMDCVTFAGEPRLSLRPVSLLHLRSFPRGHVPAAPSPPASLEAVALDVVTSAAQEFGLRSRAVPAEAPGPTSGDSDPHWHPLRDGRAIVNKLWTLALVYCESRSSMGGPAHCVLAALILSPFLYCIIIGFRGAGSKQQLGSARQLQGAGDRSKPVASGERQVAASSATSVRNEGSQRTLQGGSATSVPNESSRWPLPVVNWPCPSVASPASDASPQQESQAEPRPSLMSVGSDPMTEDTEESLQSTPTSPVSPAKARSTNAFCPDLIVPAESLCQVFLPLRAWKTSRKAVKICNEGGSIVVKVVVSDARRKQFVLQTPSGKSLAECRRINSEEFSFHDQQGAYAAKISRRASSSQFELLMTSGGAFTYSGDIVDFEMQVADASGRVLGRAEKGSVKQERDGLGCMTRSAGRARRETYCSIVFGPGSDIGLLLCGMLAAQLLATVWPVADV